MLFHLNSKYVRTASTILRVISKMRGLGTSKFDPNERYSKRRWDCRGDLGSQRRFYFFKKKCTNPPRRRSHKSLKSHTLRSLRVIWNFLVSSPVKSFWMTSGSRSATKEWIRIFIDVWGHSKKLREAFNIELKTLLEAGNARPNITFEPIGDIIALARVMSRTLIRRC